MNVEDKVQALLSASLPAYGSPSVVLVPAIRIRTPGDWQNLVRPYIVHFPISADPIYTHQGRAALTPWRNYQVTVVADSWSSARLVANAVRDILDGNHDGVQFFYRNTIGLPWDFERRVQEIAVDFEIFEAL
jgi:hypothetical protein